ncbi:MAG TPA: N-glycosylase/DNA lyase [Nitrososphaeria archaeon]|nr:N-glycosylase/DNA lyase [Nitrososphaeria archaeon]
MNSSGLEKVLEDVRKLMKDPEVRRLVESRIASFRRLRRASSKDIFMELAFCILAANFTASRSLEIVEKLGDRLMTLDRSEIARELRRLGHRYPEARARYLVEAREKLDEIIKAIEEVEDEHRLRRWLAENVPGLGFKEASHFLRNIGFQNLAIIDFHIIRLLKRYGLLGEFRSLTRRRYLEIEKLLREIADRLGLSLAELDLYLWYLDSGRIIK